MGTLFTPICINGLEIKNRYVMAPMGNIGQADAQGAFTKSAVDYFAARAKGGVGLIITGICHVAPHIEQIPPTRIPMPTVNPAAFTFTATEMTERVHAWGSKIFMQLSAGFGYAGKPATVRNRVAPSAIGNRWQPELQHRALTRSEIYEYIEGFAESAKIAQKSGFDGVEIHAVHEGYLLDQFTIAFYNHRQDEFGGDLVGRLRFPTEIVKAIKKRCGQDFPVILRFSLKSFIKGPRQGALPGEIFKERGRDTTEGLAVARLLVAAGYDALDVDVGTYDSWYWNHPPMYFGKKGIYLEFSQLVKGAVDVPVIAAGRMDDAELAELALESGLCDLVSLGRPLLADPDLPNKVLTNKIDTIRPCLSCHEGCMGRFAKGAALSCAVNPTCGREETYELDRALLSKRVMIVGGGIAGMEAARTAALRGHTVDLYEKSDRLGGVVIPGGMPPFKSDDHALLRWYEQALLSSSVDIHYNCRVTIEDVVLMSPDAIIISTGSRPIIPNIPRHPDMPMLSATEVLMDTNLAGNKVAIIGAGLVGCELGLWLKRSGRDVTIIEASSQILGGPDSLPFMNYDMLKDLLVHEEIPVYKETKVVKLNADSIELAGETENKRFKVDTVIYAIGYTSENTLWEQVKRLSIETYLLGDARKVRNIMYAIWDAYEVGRGL